MFYSKKEYHTIFSGCYIVMYKNLFIVSGIILKKYAFLMNVLKFIFRLIVVTMVGSQVYGDEQGQFKDGYVILSLNDHNLNMIIYTVLVKETRGA